MNKISAADIKKIRELTGAGVMDIKKSLKESRGDRSQAIIILRKKGQKLVEKKASRAANQGLVEAYIHPGGKVGVLLEVNCETDFVARSGEFKDLAHNLALHIAGMSPRYIEASEISARELEKEKEIYIEQLHQAGKDEKLIKKILAGKINKYAKEVCLLDQPFVKNPEITVREYLAEKVAKLGENIKIRRFVIYRLGE